MPRYISTKCYQWVQRTCNFASVLNAKNK